MHVHVIACGECGKWLSRVGLSMCRVALAAGRRLWWCGDARGNGDFVGFGTEIKEDDIWTWDRLRTGWEPSVGCWQ